MSDTTHLRIAGPGALVAAVPHLLGFVPDDSLVAVGLRSPCSQVCLTLRADLAAVASERGLVDRVVAQLRRAAAEEVVVVLAGHPVPDGAVAVPFADHANCAAACLPYPAVVTAVRAAASAHGLAFKDALWTDRGRWWSYLCEDPRCCPAEGNVVDPAAAADLAAALALSGRAVLPDRTALALSVAPQLPLEPDILVDECTRASLDATEELDAVGPHAFGESTTRALRAAMDRCAPGGPGLAPGETATLAGLLIVGTVWFDALRWLGGPAHDAAQAMLLQLTRSSPPPFGATPAALLGLYAYARGDGALARVCADRAAADEGGGHDEVTEYLHLVLDSGMPPEEVTAVMRKVLFRLGRAGSR